MYYLSSLVAPLLAAIMEYVDLSVNMDPTTQRFHRFFRVLTQGKPDVYLDLLEVIAYHTPSARFAGLSILARYWPKALGHLTMSRSIGIATFDPRDRENGGLARLREIRLKTTLTRINSCHGISVVRRDRSCSMDCLLGTAAFARNA